MKRVLIILCILLLPFAAPAAIVSRTVEYSQGGTTFKGYMAHDDAKAGKRPGVLVVHEWWGLNDYIRMRANQLAKMGYVVFAPDIYGNGVSTTDPNEAKRLSGQAGPQVRERAAAGLDILRKNQLVDPKRIAAIGFCFGGMTVLELAYSGAEVAGVVTFHGILPAPKPEDEGRIRTRFLVLHGAEDTFVKPESVAAFQDALRRVKADWQMVTFSGAVHAFTNPKADTFGIQGIGYNQKAAERSWQYMQDFFREIFK
jgi:dienelactone hydrolase